MSDEEIVRLVQNGKIEEYGEIVKKYDVQLFRYIKRVVNQEDEEVEDLLQNTFIKSFENIQGFDVKKKFSSWIYRIAHNICIDYFRQKKMVKLNVEDQEEWLGSGEKLIEELEIEKEEKKKIGEAVKRLEVKYREVVWLYYFEDKSYDEISDILHIQRSNVGVMLNRAREKLKKILNPKS